MGTFVLIHNRSGTLIGPRRPERCSAGGLKSGGRLAALDELTTERVFARRLYQTLEWRRLRRKKISAQPLCEVCLETETVEPATVVSHRVRHNGDRSFFFDCEQLVSLCRQHLEEARLAKGL